MSETEDSSPDFIFRPKARLMVLLGDQLIKNHTLALFELVKNAYDADAENAILTLLDIDSDDGLIEVEDDGLGMDLNTIKNVWLEPANNHKAEFRNQKKRTFKGRLPVGEKGVGRFAVHRLGNRITMVTKAQGAKEVVVDIDWIEFLKNDYLDEAPVTVIEREPEVFKGDKTGTRITLSDLRQKWKRGDIRKLYRSVSSMTPVSLDGDENFFDEVLDKDTAQTTDSGDFKVDFILSPDRNWLSDLFSPSLAASQALFRFDYVLSDEGLSYQYRFTPFEAMKAEYKGVLTDRTKSEKYVKSFEFFSKSPPDDAISMKNRVNRDAKPLLGSSTKGIGIGPLKGTILGFDFDQEIYDRYQHDENKGLADYLRQQGGVRVYRDGLRVYNYGEPGDDWLHLDHRRIQGPTKRLGSRQLLGTLFLQLEESEQLIEKTNREGFVENDAYNELVYAMLCILAQFEAERNKDKRYLKSVLTTAPGSSDSKESKRRKTADELIDHLKQDVISKEEYKELRPIVEQVSKAYKETRDALMSAAGAGMGLVTVFHELERGVRNLHQAIEERLDSAKLREMSVEIVSLLRGAMYMVSTKQMETISASRLVDYVLLTQGRRFKRHGIELLNGFKISKNLDFDITGIRRMLTTAIINLLDNAIYWADTSEDEDKYIWIGPSHELEGPAIAIADSGPGFIDEIQDVVQPFFTRKSAGMGIGLYYSDMAMKSHKGRLYIDKNNTIEKPSKTPGACIVMVFKAG
ncbi:MAG: ATP-binding protein [Flavobacteriaceae bacterium]|nr:ATP-binding protein [Flavobacteriaceae bacterium]